jgi:hypothetical protein
MKLLTSIFLIILYLYSLIFIIFMVLFGCLARIFYNPGDLFLCFRLTLLVNQIKEIYEVLPRVNSFISVYRRL